MTYISIDHFIHKPNNKNISSLMLDIDSLGLNSNTYENNTLFIASYILQQRYTTEVNVYYSFLNVDRILVDNNINNKYGISCAYYLGNEYHYSDLFTKLEHIVSSGKTAFIYLDLDSYSIDVVENSSNLHEEVSHATALIIYPDKNNIYKAFHFNPHGNDIEHYYEKYISRSRKKYIF